MIARMLLGNLPDVEFVHVRMAFSRDFSELKKFQWRKVVELARVIFGIVCARFKHNARVLYYPPSGPDFTPVLRDIAILGATRWLFRCTIFHFHAGGLASIYPRLGPLMRIGFHLAFRRPDYAIRLSEASPDDGRALEARERRIVPNGIDDNWAPDKRVNRDGRTILFVGMLSESKGVLVLADACLQLKQRAVECRFNLMGKFPTAEAERTVRERIAKLGIEDRFRFLGELHSEAKWEAFARASIFCFPSYYESESFPVAVIEAMSCALPVVATRWRGIPELVVDQETGYLVDPRDATALADRLQALLCDGDARRRLGEAGRARYLRCYTTSVYLGGLHRVFRDALAQAGR